MTIIKGGNSRRGATIVVGDGQRDHDLVELFKHKLGGLRARGPTLGSQRSGMGCQKSDVWVLSFGSQQRTQHPGPYKAPVKREDRKLVRTFQNLLAMSVACPNQSKTRSIVLVFSIFCITISFIIIPAIIIIVMMISCIITIITSTALILNIVT